jgi:metal-sulfur cluster biosynthetic enzyme
MSMVPAAACCLADVLPDVVRGIKDPEHPYTLEQLSVVDESLVEVEKLGDDYYAVKVTFVPTVPHCSLATTIGLSIRYKLQQELTQRMKVSAHRLLAF